MRDCGPATVICEMKKRVATGALLVMLLGAWVVWKPGKGKAMVDYSQSVNQMVYG